MDEKEYRNLILGSLLDPHIKEECLKGRNLNNIIQYILEQKALEMKEQQMKALTFEILCQKLAIEYSQPALTPSLSREIGTHPNF